MTAIVELEDFRIYIRDEADGIDDPVLQSFLDAAIQGFANATQRQLIRVDDDTDATPRVFAADPCRSTLRIHDCTEVVSITENGSVLTADSYQLEPLNAVSFAGEPIPYEKIRKLRSHWYSDCGRAAISVNAKWGWSSFPAGMVEAVKTLGKEICNNQDIRLGIAAVNDVAVSGIRTNKIVRDAVMDYRRIEAIGIA